MKIQWLKAKKQKSPETRKQKMVGKETIGFLPKRSQRSPCPPFPLLDSAAARLVKTIISAIFLSDSYGKELRRQTPKIIQIEDDAYEMQAPFPTNMHALRCCRD